MSSLVPRTALRGVSQSPNDKMAQGLGYFSIGLGLAELLAPQSLCRMLDMEGDETLIRAYGVRELATGVAILTSHDPTPWIWGRVAGDALDIAHPGDCHRGTPEKRQRGRGLRGPGRRTALDAICATGLTAEKGGPAGRRSRTTATAPVSPARAGHAGRRERLRGAPGHARSRPAAAGPVREARSDPGKRMDRPAASFATASVSRRSRSVPRIDARMTMIADRVRPQRST